MPLPDSTHFDLDDQFPPVIFSYCSKTDSGRGEDHMWRLANFLKQRGISSFNGKQVEAGQDWMQKWLGKMPEAKICIAMLSPDYFKSGPCKEEVYCAAREGLTIIPVIFETPPPFKSGFFGGTGDDREKGNFVKQKLGNWLPTPDQGLFQHNFETHCEKLLQQVTKLLQSGASSIPPVAGASPVSDSSPPTFDLNISHSTKDDSTQAEARLGEKVRAGNAEVIEQMCQLQQRALPQLLSAVKQQALELRCCASEGLSAEELAEVHAAVQAALKEAAAQTAGSDESLKMMLEDVLAKGPAEGAAAGDMLGKLDALAARMEAMQAQFTELGGKVGTIEARTAAQAEAMAKLGNTLDQLALGENEQIFRYFLLVPKPAPRGLMGKRLRVLSPKNWLTKPMLLVPYYKDDVGALQPAPLAGAARDAGGFEVAKGKDFVKKYPRAVMFTMWAIKVGIKVAAAQLCVTVPATTLDALGSVTDGVVNELLSTSIGFMQGFAVNDEGGLTAELEEKLDSFLEQEQPEDALASMVANERFVEMSKLDYRNLKSWMDKQHQGWEKNCGLVQVKNTATGRIEWRPPTALVDDD